MAARVLEFRLGRPETLPDLLHEFGLHDDLAVSIRRDDADAILVVEAANTAAAAWTVRAVVRSFDESAVEL